MHIHSLDDYIIEETFRRGVITIITTSRHLFTLLSLFSSLYKRENCKTKTDIVFMKCNCFPWLENYCVHRVHRIHSLFHKSHSEFYLPFFSPSLAVPFTHLKVKKQSGDILDRGESKALSSHPKQGIHPLFFNRE